jgi:hypothetical protein
MLRSIVSFTVGLAFGVSVMAVASSSGQSSSPASSSSVVQLRFYAIDKSRLDEFAAAWRTGVYPPIEIGLPDPTRADIIASAES